MAAKSALFLVTFLLLVITASKFISVPIAFGPGISEEIARGAEMPAGQAGEEGKQNSRREVPAAKKPESKLVAGKAIRSQGRVIGFPLHFTAAAGETVGVIRAQVTIPEGVWKFQKADAAPGSRLKVSAKQENQGTDANGQSRRTVIELSFSAGGHAIRDGLIGFLRFSAAPAGTPGTEIPAVRIVGTEPPKAEQVTTAPTEPSFPLPPEPTINPGVGCFFFTH